ncbi:hypothetical protein [Serratia ureilytica]|uniref:hypothetical protein n=1 Tax=Serratia ureilytica TaxID=300181 RepID=UPI001F05A5E4|nr:hypothetical protein [Serratia ureilytica]UMK53601.1 hypothetical protein L2D49_04450 [Serratia ureilytica]
MKKLFISLLALAAPAAAVDFGPSGSRMWMVSGTCLDEGKVVDTYNGRVKDQPAPTVVDSGWQTYVGVDTDVVCRNHRFTRYGRFSATEGKVDYMWIGSGARYTVDFVRYAQRDGRPAIHARWDATRVLPPISPNETVRVTVPITRKESLRMFDYSYSVSVSPNCASVAVDPIDGTKPLSVTITGMRVCSYTAVIKIIGNVK